MIKNRLFQSIGALSIAAIAVVPMVACAEHHEAAEHGTETATETKPAETTSSSAGTHTEEASEDGDHGCGSKGCEGKDHAEAE